MVDGNNIILDIVAPINTMGAFLLCGTLKQAGKQAGKHVKEEISMQAKTEITKAIFGFKDKETGEQLRAFFKKHTGRDVDFNSIKHYTDGFKLLVFSIPLNTVDIIGITAAGCAPHYVKRFCGLKDFIEWYENIYNPQNWEEDSYLRNDIRVDSKEYLSEF